MTRFRFLLLCVLVLAGVACGREEAGRGGLDVSDPNAVAQAAWEAIQAEDFDAYLALVVPGSRQRETREQWLDSIRTMKRAPGFPRDPELVITPQEEPDRVVAGTRDLRFGMGMVFADGRWWMD